MSDTVLITICNRGGNGGEEDGKANEDAEEREGEI